MMPLVNHGSSFIFVLCSLIFLNVSDNAISKSWVIVLFLQCLLCSLMINDAISKAWVIATFFLYSLMMINDAISKAWVIVIFVLCSLMIDDAVSKAWVIVML